MTGEELFKTDFIPNTEQSGLVKFAQQDFLEEDFEVHLASN